MFRGEMKLRQGKKKISLMHIHIEKNCDAMG